MSSSLQGNGKASGHIVSGEPAPSYGGTSAADAHATVAAGESALTAESTTALDNKADIVGKRTEETRDSVDWPRNLPAGFRLDRGFLIEEKARDGPISISGPVWVTAYTKDAKDHTFGLVIYWIDRTGNHHEQAFPYGVLHEPGKSLAQTLARYGLFILPGKEHVLNRYLACFKPKQCLRSVSCVGWLDSIDGKLAYVLPGKPINCRRDEQVIFQPEQHSPSSHTISTQGTLADWQAEVVALCRGNPYLVFSLCVSFAGPLLKFASQESGGFHIYGPTSRGKTTAAQVAASVFGCGADPSDAPGQSYIQRWNTTDNALEGLLAAHNDLVLILDEIHTCDAKDFGRVIYNMAGGRGKSTMDKDRNLRPRRAWRAMYLSMGEISARQKIEENGKRAHAGQLLRLADIPAAGNIIVNSHGLAPGGFVGQLKRACGKYFGTAGTEFFRALAARYTGHGLTAIVRDELERQAKTLIRGEVEPEQRRVLNRFALVAAAGALASRLEVLNVSEVDIQDSVRAVATAWLADASNVLDRLRGAQAVQQFILCNESRFRRACGDACNSIPIRSLAGYTDRQQSLYLFTSDGFRDACSGCDHKVVAQELNALGLVFKNDGSRLTSKHMVAIDGQNKRMRLYAVRSAILEHDFAEGSFFEQELLGQRDSWDTSKPIDHLRAF